MNRILKGAAMFALMAATPVIAGAPDRAATRGHGGVHGAWGETMGALTPEGRKIMREAMREGRAANPGDIGAARDRMLEILGADRLDVAALRRAMQDEQRLAVAQQQRHQDAMLAAFQKLSPRDRKAFAVSMRAQQFRMDQMRKDVESRMAKWRERRSEVVVQGAAPVAPAK